MTRRQQLADGVQGVRARIAAACASAGRPAGDVRLVVVTKGFPARDVRLLADIGVRDVGESKDQEARAKLGQLADLDLAWHFVGRLQTNKARSVARYAQVVHSVDRERLVSALSAGAQAAGRTIDCLVQVSLERSGRQEGPARGGVPPDGVDALADRVAAAAGLRLKGVMAVAPIGDDPGDAFGRLAAVAAGLRGRHPDAAWVSAGMSADLEAAVGAGATHVRVGSAILGPRPSAR